MPELPEVETVTRGLRAALVGHVIAGVEVRRARSLVPPDAEGFVRRLTGRRVTAARRRGKWILLPLDSGDTLVAHLRMTGQLVLSDSPPADPYVRVLFTLDDGRYLRFSDQRKFGRLWLTADSEALVGDLGPEPLGESFTVAWLREHLRGRRRRIKSLLLDQHFLAGLGNIYTDESLWRAGVHPLRRADGLTDVEVERLHGAIRAVLREAIATGGTTLSDGMYRRADGEAGGFVVRLAVYGRKGEPCPRCGTPIERIRVAQRGTHFCPRCQPVPG